MRISKYIFIYFASISCAQADNLSVCEPYYDDIENSQLTVDQCLDELDDLGRGALNAPGCLRVIRFNSSMEFHAAYDRAERMIEEAGDDATWGSIKSSNIKCKDEIDVWILASEMSALDELRYFMENP